jgi:hypothetical protein
VKAVYTTKTGLQLMDEDCTPAGEVWFTVPIAADATMTYMISLNDWRVTLQNGDESFLDQLDRWLGELHTTVESGQSEFASAKIDLIRQACQDFKSGK